MFDKDCTPTDCEIEKMFDDEPINLKVPKVVLAALFVIVLILAAIMYVKNENNELGKQVVISNSPIKN